MGIILLWENFNEQNQKQKGNDGILSFDFNSNAMENLIIFNIYLSLKL